MVRLVSKYLDSPGGRAVLDIGGGTGNYAQALQARGFKVTVLDAEFAMAERSIGKIGPGRQVVGDASALPFSDGVFDAAIMIHAIHLLRDPSAACREARRVIREGPFALVGPVKENASLFVHEYFEPPPAEGSRPSSAEMEKLLVESGFTRVEHTRLVYTDDADGSLYALHTNALHLAGPAYLRNTTFWYQLDEDSRRRGLEALAKALRSGELDRRVKEHVALAADRGHETVFAAWP
jgi:SAM-dependent methyltransferase